ncbi:hypothetical protein SLS60_006836 [Paraconiothyrium brasiliense]|uniref:Uncharacterized protein n=1 Tax=Paraconiothyrium brasiliense TaxID=300254 RepID=A0ABR3R7N3_9PLEO
MAYKALLSMFRNATAGGIARHVRSITVQTKIPSEDLIMILDTISEFGKLRELNWNTSAHIPRAVLQKLHSTWPDLEISAAVIDREDAENGAYRKMDLGLLSSPLLARLTYVVYERGYRSDRTCRSEWPKLSQALLSGGNIRSMVIQSQQDSSSAYHHDLVEDTEPERLPRLGLSLGVGFPKLEQLRIRNQIYYTSLWDEEHCRTLRNSIDPSRLRALEFGDDNPEAFFATFTGILPNLKSLRFGVKINTSLQPAEGFIDSLSGLKSLHIGGAHRGLDELWRVIEKHRDTLKTLILGPTWGQYGSPEYIDRSLLETIPQAFPNIERLGWHAPLQYVNDDDFLAMLSTMNLRHLDMFTHISGEASEYSEKLDVDVAQGSNNPPLNRTQSIAAATRIADTVSQKQKDPLERLTLHLARTLYMDRFQPYTTHTAFQLRRNDSSTAKDEKYHVRGKMHWWYSGQPLKEELLFEEETAGVFSAQ